MGKKEDALRKDSFLIKEAIDSSLEEIALPLGIEEKDKKQPLKLNLAILNRYIDWLYPGNIILIIGPRYCGKTSLVANITLTTAQSDKAVLFFSPGLRGQALVSRFISIQSGINIDEEIIKYHFEPIQPEYLLRILKASAFLGTLPIYIDDRNLVSFDTFEREVINLSKEVNLSLIIVDYLQQIEKQKEIDRKEKTFKKYILIRQLKLLAVKLRLPIILVARLDQDLKYDSRVFKIIQGYTDIIIYLERKVICWGKIDSLKTLLTIYKNNSGFLPKGKLIYYVNEGIVKEGGRDDEKTGRFISNQG